MSMFLALYNRFVFSGSIRNGFFVINRSSGNIERYYFFSVHAGNDLSKVFSPGIIYICPKTTFQPLSNSPVRFDEWISYTEVPIAGRLRVEPEDFPFDPSIIPEHVSSESIFETWMQYKSRIGISS